MHSAMLSNVYRLVMVSQSGFKSFRFNKYNYNFSSKLPILFICLYDMLSSAAKLGYVNIPRADGEIGWGCNRIPFILK